MRIKLFAVTGLAALSLAGAAFAGGSGDVSGPCDEAEHAQDARCTGAAPAQAQRRNDDGRRDDHGRHRRGKGSGRSGHR